jgi:hypothetical protein
MSGAKLKMSTVARKERMLSNKLVRFTIGDDIFEKSWKVPGYADRIACKVSKIILPIKAGK